MTAILGYWQCRGLAHALRMLLHYKEVDYEDRLYSSEDKKDWLDDKFNLGLDLPNLPYYIDGDVKVTETSAIFAYLGRKYDLSGCTEKARIRNDMTYSLWLEERAAFMAVCYHEEFDTLKVQFLANLPKRLERISKWLGKHPYFGGAEILYADFCMHDLLDTLRVFSPGCLDKHEKLTEFMCRVENLPTLKKFLESDIRMHRGPFYAEWAKWGGTVVA